MKYDRIPVRMMDEARTIKLLSPSKVRGMRPPKKPRLVSMAAGIGEI
jgi:hypothetical protein